MQILIRDGSVSKDVHALAPIISAETSPLLGLCTDDRNPLDIAEEGHLDHLIRAAIRQGAPVAHVYRAATWSAAQGFGLRDRGLVAPGRRADLVLLDDLEQLRGVAGDQRRPVGRAGDLRGPRGRRRRSASARSSSTRWRWRISARPTSGPTGPVIGLIPGKIITDALTATLPWRDGCRHPDPDQDILKICVFARHGVNRNIGRAFVQGLRLPRRGAGLLGRA